MKRKLNRVIKFLISSSLIIGLLSIILNIAIFIGPNYIFNHPKEIKVISNDGKYTYSRYFNQYGSYVSLDNMSSYFPKAVVAAEDKRFYKHNGLDYLRIISSALSNIKNSSIKSGGSTITQQLARTLYLSNEKSFKRKLKEAMIAKKIEMTYSKEQILEAYLNVAYFGHNLYGVSQASNYYYQKSPKSLSLGEVALLIGILPSPTNYSPDINLNLAIKQQHNVLNTMLKQGLITNSEYLKATTETLDFKYSFTSDHSMNLLFYHDAMIRQLENNKILTTNKQNIGYQINSCLDKNVQDIIEKTTNKYSFKSEISVIVMKPYSGDVLGLVGGKDYSSSPYNRALNAKRQTGSTIKPLLYYLGLENGMTPLTKFKSEPTTFYIDGVGEYSPSNANNKYANKEITMLEAIALSDNIYATKTVLLLGSKMIKNLIEKFHISNIEANPTIGLGSNSLTPLELAAIYNTFASEGYYYPPRFYRQISTIDNRILSKNSSKSEFKLRSDSVLQINYLLRSPFDKAFKSYATPSLLNYIPKYRFSAKTGTTTSDRWVVGFNPQYTICVWMGNDDNSEFQDGDVAKRIFVDIANSLMDKKKDYFYPTTNLKPFSYKGSNQNISFTYYKK